MKYCVVIDVVINSVRNLKIIKRLPPTPPPIITPLHIGNKSRIISGIAASEKKMKKKITIINK